MIRIIGDIIGLLLLSATMSLIIIFFFSMALPVIIGNLKEAKKKLKELKDE